MTAREAFEVIISGTPEMTSALLKLFCDEWVGRRVRLDAVKGDWGEGYDLKLTPSGQTIGRFLVIGMPGGRVLIHERVLPALTSEHPELLPEFINHIMGRFSEYGLLPRTSRFKSASILDTARRQLGASDESEAYAAIANVCRIALISLGKELSTPDMFGDDEEPKGDDAGARLKAAARFYWGARSGRQLEGINRTIEGTWIVASSALHRQHATLEEAELCVRSASLVSETTNWAHQAAGGETTQEGQPEGTILARSHV